MIYGGVGIDTVYPDKIYIGRSAYNSWHKNINTLS